MKYLEKFKEDSNNLKEISCELSKTCRNSENKLRKILQYFMETPP